MLTHLTIRNFKRLGEVEIELGDSVVFVGPNNAGKTTALQALALWSVGLKLWIAKRGGDNSKAKERTGVTLNRRDLVALPVPSANLLWKDLHTRSSQRVDGKLQTKNLVIEIGVQGIIDGKAWQCHLEFDYANAESFYCRPTQALDEHARKQFSQIAQSVQVAYLPPMSGLAPREFKAERGQINVLIGEGQTAQVLRNLCLSVYENEDKTIWPTIVTEIRSLFGVTLQDPVYVPGRSEVEMVYIEGSNKVPLDLSSAGRGMQQSLLLLAYLHANPGSTILLDEPDAHLEVLRQRQTYNIISRLAREQRSQIIVATHSEIILNEAAGKHTVVAFVGKPHRLNDQGSQLKKALLSIGFEHYLQAEQTGWVLYLEGSTDLAILQQLAKRLNHPAQSALERPYVDYVNSNTPPAARDRFWGLREACPTLTGLAIFDRLDRPMQFKTDASALTEISWGRREIENYLCTRETLMAWAGAQAGEPPLQKNEGQTTEDLFWSAQQQQMITAMEKAIQDMESAQAVLRKPSPWSPDIKATDDFLDGLFANFLESVELPRETMYKKDYHRLAEFIPLTQIDSEITEKLDLIAATALAAKRPLFDQ